MISNLNDAKKTDLPDYDVCIVGSGPAGMTAANELKDSGLKVCVLESGKLRPTKLGDRLREVRSEGIHIKDYSRERILGGASTTWSGLSSPLDPVDMKSRPFLPYSGWPIPREALMPYYEKATKGYRFPPLEIFSAGGLDVLKKKGDLQLTWSRVEEKIFMAAGEPQHFGREYRHIFDKADVDLYLDATVLRLKWEGRKRSIACAHIRTSGGQDLQLKAKIFVLATGGIENARLLLNSRDLCPQGLGNGHDQVGRYLMNHPKNYYGIIRLKRPVKELPYYFGCLYQGYAGYAGIKLTESIQEELGCLNSYARFEPLFPWSDNQGVKAFVLIAKRSKLLLKSWKKGKEGGVVSLRDYSETGEDTDLQNERKSAIEWVGVFFKVLFSIHHVLNYLYHRLVKKTGPDIKTIRLRNFMEMEPDPENRVLLGEEKDAYGQPVPVVRHRCSELDRRSLVALHETLVDEVAQNDLGQLISRLHEENPWPINLDASHHMGTTRMGEDPRTSVVNSDCRLHDIDNVYLAGGSVFPTSGCANPTFTMVALSIRLAEHLGEQVFESN